MRKKRKEKNVINGLDGDLIWCGFRYCGGALYSSMQQRVYARVLYAFESISTAHIVRSTEPKWRKSPRGLYAFELTCDCVRVLGWERGKTVVVVEVHVRFYISTLAYPGIFFFFNCYCRSCSSLFFIRSIVRCFFFVRTTIAIIVIRFMRKFIY